jgi:hypothetical protein
LGDHCGLGGEEAIVGAPFRIRTDMHDVFYRAVMFALAKGTLAAKSIVVLEGELNLESSSETFFSGTVWFICGVTVRGSLLAAVGEFEMVAKVLEFLGEDGDVLLGKDGTFFRFLALFLGCLVLPVLSRRGKVRVEKAITNVSGFKRLINRGLGLVFRKRLVGAVVNVVQSRVFGGCFGVMDGLVNSSRSRGIVVLSSTVTSRKRVLVLVGRTLEVLCSRTSDSCLHGSLPAVPRREAGDGSEELRRG